MNESIRDYLRRRVHVGMGIGLAGWLLVAVAIVSTHGREQPPPLVTAGFLVFGGAILFLQWIRCPRCSTRLGQCITMGVGFSLNILGKKSPNFCPYCGVHLDQPCQQPGSAITPQ